MGRNADICQEKLCCLTSDEAEGGPGSCAVSPQKGTKMHSRVQLDSMQVACVRRSLLRMHHLRLSSQQGHMDKS